MSFNPYYYQRAPQYDQQLINDLVKAINGEYSAIACYSQLAKKAKNDEERRRILEIRKDEEKHLATFSQLYTQLTGNKPRPKNNQNCPNKYREGLNFAIKDEQETVDFYNEVADRAQSKAARKAFSRAALDEQNHAVWFLYFLTRK